MNDDTANSARIELGGGERRARVERWAGAGARLLAGALGVAGLGALVVAGRIAVNGEDERLRCGVVATKALFEAGSALADALEAVLVPAMEETRGIAADVRVAAALEAGDVTGAERICNEMVSGTRHVDAIALFDSQARIVGVNTVYGDGSVVAAERVARVMQPRDRVRKPIADCLSDLTSAETLKFQSDCVIASALFDAPGMSVAYSRAVKRAGKEAGGDDGRVGVVSVVLLLNRLTAPLKSVRIASGGGRAFLVNDEGGVLEGLDGAGHAQLQLSREELVSIVAPIVASGGVHSVVERDLTFVGVSRLSRLKTVEHGGVQVMVSLPRDWVKGEAQLARLWDASGPAAAGVVLLAFAAMVLLVQSLVGQKRAAVVAGERVRSIFAAVAEGVVLQNTQAMIVECNAAAERILGLTVDQMRGRVSVDPRWRAIREDGSEYPGQDHPSMRTLRTGEAIRAELMGVHTPEGQRRWISVSTEPIRDEDGRMTAIVVSFVDVTVQREHAERLKQTSEELDAFFESSLELLCIANQDGRFSRLNPEWERVLGFKIEELMDGEFMRFVHPDDVEATLGAMKALDAQQSLGRFENRYRCKDGTYRTLEWRASPYGKQIFAAARDVTEARLASEELARAKDLLEEAESMARLGHWSFDLTTGVVRWSKQVYRLFGRPEAEGPPDYAGVKEDYEAESWLVLDAAVKRAAAEGTPYSLVLETSQREGAVRYVRAEGRARLDEHGRVVGLFGTVMDVTVAVEQQEALERARADAQAASASKSEFLANMSHEIRTPMTAILGFAEMLARLEQNGEDVHGRQRECIETIRRNGEHLLAIINDVLDISKIESGKMTVETTETKPVEIVREVVALMGEQARTKGLLLEAMLTTAVPARVRSDPVRVRQILMNLVGNAVKFTAGGSGGSGGSGGAVTLAVSFAAAEGVLTFDVVDTGIGLSSQQCGVLFGAFVQGDASTTRKFGGTGLGLQISRRLAKMLGGDVSVASELGVGSTFTATVRVGEVAESEMVAAGRVSEAVREAVREAGGERAPGGPGAVRSQDLAGLRILLAEDGPDNQRLLLFHLRHAGAVVTLAENGKLALELLEREGASGLGVAAGFDLLLTDIQMPEMDGYALTRELRARGSTMAIVALTAHAMRSDVERCLAAGCDAYASKPISPRELVAVCRRAIEKRAKVEDPQS